MKRLLLTLSVVALAACQSDGGTLLQPELAVDVQPAFSSVLVPGLTSFDDRAEFDAATAAAAMSSEDFEDSLVPLGFITPCGFGPMDAGSDNVCFAPGNIAAGVTFSALESGGGEAGTFSVYGPGAGDVTSATLVASGIDQHSVAVDFDPAVKFAALDLVQPEVLPPPPGLPGPPPSSHLCTVEVYDAGGLLHTESDLDCPAAGAFFGVSSDTPITRIVVRGPAGLPPFGEVAPGVDNVAFGSPVASEITKESCKKGGYNDFGFKNQGQCIRYVETGKDSR